MRRYIRDNISQLLASISEGVIYIGNMIGNGREAVFNDCVDSICSIEEVIQKQITDKNRFEVYNQIFNNIISLLQELKEQLLNNRDVNALVKQLLDKVSMMKQMIDAEEGKLEVVFMPYKASMWDCMESVWEQATKEEICDCYVVPIPYYEKKDGKVYKEVYEGDIFPDSVKITHYNNYNLADRNPDIIFIHNPYDGYNIITTVHPNYYSDELKKYTNNLVYIPYFVAGVYTDCESTLRSTAMPAFKNVDWIIAQSEAHKQMLLRVGIDTNKVLVCGNPKFDAALRTLEGHYSTPNEWVEKFQGKKVFLYNSSISNLLVDNESLKKLDKEIDEIISNPNCGIIWRPHPLLEATIIAMRDNLQKQYMKIKRKILQSPNAVIDNNASTYPAIQMSDALISDYSSVMFQYAATGKPILCVDVNYKVFVDSTPLILAINYSSYYFMNPWVPGEQIKYNPEIMADINGTSVKQFVEMILADQDPRKEQRMKELHESITNVDGKCGEKTFVQLLEKVLINS